MQLNLIIALAECCERFTCVQVAGRRRLLFFLQDATGSFQQVSAGCHWLLS